MDMRRGTRTLLAGLAVTAVLGTAGTASAAGGTHAAGPVGDGAKALCKRAPKVDRRIERALRRLDAGAGTRGSVARLEKRVDNAKKAGHTEIATFLQNRLTFRKSLGTTLRQRQKDLAAVRTWCRGDDDGKAAG